MQTYVVQQGDCVPFAVEHLALCRRIRIVVIPRERAAAKGFYSNKLHDMVHPKGGEKRE